MNTLKSFEYTIPSKIYYICECISGILDYLDKAVGSISEERVYELKVILNELLINAIRHGNNECSRKNVYINVGLIDKRTVFIIVMDEGCGFDYDKVLNCKFDLNNCGLFDMKETGRGLRIVNCLSDKMKFNNKGNKVVVVKRIL